MLDKETERKNMLWGWGLFVLFCLIGGGDGRGGVHLPRVCD